MTSSHAVDVTHDARDPEIIVHALAWRRRRRDAIIRMIQSALHLADDSMHDRSQFPDNGIQVYNAHHERDIRYATQLFRWILQPIGIWHLIYARSSRMEKLFSATMIFVCLAVLSFVLVPSSPYALFSKNDINTKAKLIGPMFFCLTAAIKYCILGMRSERIGRCVEQIENDWRIVRYQDHRRMMLDNALVGRRLTMLSVIFLYTGGMSYHIILPLFVSRGNLTNKPLIYQGYDVYFDSQASPAYDIVFSVHCMCAMIQYNITTATCSLAAIFMMHVCGQIQILMTMLDDLIEGKRDKGTTVEKRLSMIARYHVRMLRWEEHRNIRNGLWTHVSRFTTEVEQLLHEMCLLELVAATLIICLLEYYFMMVRE